MLHSMSTLKNCTLCRYAQDATARVKDQEREGVWHDVRFQVCAKNPPNALSNTSSSFPVVGKHLVCFGFSRALGKSLVAFWGLIRGKVAGGVT